MQAAINESDHQHSGDIFPQDPTNNKAEDNIDLPPPVEASPGNGINEN
jgi:hypothetical protein